MLEAACTSQQATSQPWYHRHGLCRGWAVSLFSLALSAEAGDAMCDAQMSLSLPTFPELECPKLRMSLFCYCESCEAVYTFS